MTLGVPVSTTSAVPSPAAVRFASSVTVPVLSLAPAANDSVRFVPTNPIRAVDSRDNVTVNAAAWGGAMVARTVVRCPSASSVNSGISSSARSRTVSAARKKEPPSSAAGYPGTPGCRAGRKSAASPAVRSSATTTRSAPSATPSAAAVTEPSDSRASRPTPPSSAV